jgi:hypothetical protein
MIIIQFLEAKASQVNPGITVISFTILVSFTLSQISGTRQFFNRCRQQDYNVEHLIPSVSSFCNAKYFIPSVFSFCYVGII